MMPVDADILNKVKEPVETARGLPNTFYADPDVFAAEKRVLFGQTWACIGFGKDVPEMLRNDLDLELSVVAALRQAISLCEQERDYQTREILEAMLADTEEDHAYWLEQQLGLIDKAGLQNYLQSQM